MFYMWKICIPSPRIEDTLASNNRLYDLSAYHSKISDSVKMWNFAVSEWLKHLDISGFNSKCRWWSWHVCAVVIPLWRWVDEGWSLVCNKAFCLSSWHGTNRNNQVTTKLLMQNLSSDLKDNMKKLKLKWGVNWWCQLQIWSFAIIVDNCRLHQTGGFSFQRTLFINIRLEILYECVRTVDQRL